MLKRLDHIGWQVVSVVMLAVAWWLVRGSPVMTTSTRVLLVGLPVLCWISWLTLCGRLKWRVLFWASACVPVVLAAAVFLLPGRAPERETVRTYYVDALRSYKGVFYVRGGESRRGIDGAGLARSALIDAHLRLGLAEKNPRLLRTAIALWWHDASAQSLGQGADGRTVLLTKAASINEEESGGLLPGDLAVTQDGAQVLAFLGEDEWIEADADMRRVIIVSVPVRHGSFDVPVQFVRWIYLDYRAS